VEDRYKYKHFHVDTYIDIHMQNVVPKGGTARGDWGRGKEERMTGWTLTRYITPVQERDTVKQMENCWTLDGGKDKKEEWRALDWFKCNVFTNKYQGMPQWTVNRRLNNGGQECRPGHVRGGHSGREKVNGEGKGRFTFYTCMNMEQWNLSKSFPEEE
jgi:hypothetical protein